MKRILSFIMLLLLTITLVACKKDIKAPENLSITNDVLKWDAVDNADKYYVVVGLEEHEALSNEFNLKQLELSAGNYTIGVITVIGDNVSRISETINYKVEFVIAAPGNVKLEGSVVSWDSVDGANQYIVFVNDEQHRQTATSIDLKTLKLDAGNYEVKIKTVIDTKTSIFSETLNYVVLHEIDDAGKTRLLKVLNPYYEANMNLEDFPSQYQYEYYLLGVEFVDIYIESASYNNVSSGNLYNLFEKIFEVLKNENIIYNFTDFTIVMGELEELGLTGNLVATLSVKLATYQLESQLSSYLENINRSIKDIEYYESLIAANKSSNEYNSIKSILTKYAITDDEKVALNEYLNTTDEKVLWEVDYIMEEFNYNLEFEYYNSDDIFYKNITNIIRNLRDAINDDFSIVYNNKYVLHEIANNNFNMSYFEMQLTSIEQQIMLSNNLLELFDNEYDNLLLSFDSLFDFVVLATKTLSNDQVIGIVNKLITGEQITLTEMILLKDVMIPVFRKSIPTKETLEYVYKTLVGISGDLVGVNIEDLMNYASMMAELNTISLEALIDFLELIDMKYLTDVQEIFSKELNYNFAILDVIIYTVDTYEEFFENTKAKYDEFLTEEKLEELYVIMFNVIIENSKEFSSEDDIVIFEIIRDNFDLIYKLSKQHENKFIPLLKSFRNLLEVYSGIYSENASDSIDILVDELLNLDAILFGDLTKDSVDPLVELIALLVDFDLNSYSTEVDDLIDIIISVNNIKTKVLIEAQKLNAKDYFEHPGLVTGDYKEIQYKTLYYIVTALNNTLNQDIKNEINDLIDSLFDKVLSNNEIKEYFGFDNQSIIELKTSMIEEVSGLYNLINEVAAYDYSNLTEEQWNTLESLVDSFYNNPEPSYNFNDAYEINVSEIDQHVVYLGDEPAVYELVFDDFGIYNIYGSYIEEYISYEIIFLDNGYYEKYSYNEVINQFHDYIDVEQTKYYIVFNNLSDNQLGFTLKIIKQ